VVSVVSSLHRLLTPLFPPDKYSVPETTETRNQPFSIGDDTMRTKRHRKRGNTGQGSKVHEEPANHVKCPNCNTPLETVNVLSICLQRGTVQGNKITDECPGCLWELKGDIPSINLGRARRVSATALEQFFSLRLLEPLKWKRVNSVA